MAFRINKAVVKLRDQPRDDSPNTAGIVLMSDVLEKLRDAPVSGWWEVQVVTSPGAPRQGFVRQDLLSQIDSPPVDPKIDEEGFFAQLGFAARAHGSNREYLYAVALLESGLQNIGSMASTAFGPFQFVRDTWQDLVARHGTDTGIRATDIVKPGAQAVFAAIYTTEAQKALTTALNRVPNANELYLAHLLGRSAAAAVLQASLDQPIDVALRVFYKGTQLGEAHVDKILAANRGLLRPAANVLTTAEVIAEITQRLDRGLAKAGALAARLGPSFDNLPGSPNGLPPWLAPAVSELNRGVVEVPGAGSNPEIEKYLTATGFGGARDGTAWCAAFINWCMLNSQNAKIVAGSRRSARAADWLTWGFPVGRAVHGAVAVTRPLVSGASGHVALTVGEGPNTVRLLGGNQRDANGQESVCERDFKKSDILEYRWLDWT
jgi:uncharacterized protein (TIGR02594 family)